MHRLIHSAPAIDAYSVSMPDSPSHSELFGPFATLGERLDDLDVRVGGATGFADAGFTDDGDYDLATAFTEALVVRVSGAISPPVTAFTLPASDEFGLRYVISDGFSLTGLTPVIDGEEVDDPDLFAAGRCPTWEGVETYTFVPWDTDSGWKAFPVLDASSLPASTYALVVDTNDDIPVWQFSD